MDNRRLYKIYDFRYNTARSKLRRRRSSPTRVEFVLTLQSNDSPSPRWTGSTAIGQGESLSYMEHLLRGWI